RTYLKALPLSLPVVDEACSVIRLLSFSIDTEWAKEEGEEAAVNRELEIAFKDYLPRNNDGIFYIKHHGPAIEAFADVLECYLSKFQDNVILKKWLENSVKSVAAVFKERERKYVLLCSKSIVGMH
ncbi:hypothetical protein BDQ17DRAFT_1252987, partial [Cyathus striatus]